MTRNEKLALIFNSAGLLLGLAGLVLLEWSVGLGATLGVFLCLFGNNLAQRAERFTDAERQLQIAQAVLAARLKTGDSHNGPRRQ